MDRLGDRLLSRSVMLSECADLQRVELSREPAVINREVDCGSPLKPARIDGTAETRIWSGHGVLARNLVKISALAA